MEHFEPDRQGPPATPRPAASVIVLRGAGAALEVLLVQRTPQARFMGGVWVFPGGAVDPGEDDRTAARRELVEEASITLPADEPLVAFSRWITPPQSRVRFDTRFYLAMLPAGAEPIVDGAEIVAHAWYTPDAALTAHARGEILLVFPTIKHLEQLRAFPSAQAVVAWADGREIVAVEPLLVGAGETARLVLPGEPE